MSGKSKGGSSRAADTSGGLSITSDDINYLVYRYLQESGFVHSAFTFGYESFVNKLNIDGHQVPPGALISILQKGLQYCEVEAEVASDGQDYELEAPATLLQAASDMVSGARRKPAQQRKRQKTKDGGGGGGGASRGAQTIDVAPEDCRVLKGHQKEVFVCSWNPSHALLASGSGDSSARIWNLEGGSFRSTVLDHNAGPAGTNGGDSASKDITTLDWNPDGTKLATGCYDGLGRVWSKDGKLLQTLQHHSGPIFSLKWNAKGDLLLSGSVDKTAIIWDAATGKVKQHFKCHAKATLDVDWRDNDSFASCSTDNHIYVCKLGQSEPVRKYSGHKDEVNAVKWDPTGTLLASCSDDCTAKVWSVDSPTCKLDLHGKDGHAKEIYTIKWSPTGPGTSNASRKLLLASASFDTTVKLWDVHGGGKCCATLQGHSLPIYSIAFSPTGEYLVSGSIDKSVGIWSVKDGSLIKKHRGEGEIFEVAWNAEGNQVAACFSNSTLSIIDFRM
jgi:transducin (beta)-like 1|eukprot:COSAG01_NODE_409_length_17390_cov_30.918223_5_plen_503_part_00